jgi:hypothetical protein
LVAILEVIVYERTVVKEFDRRGPSHGSMARYSERIRGRQSDTSAKTLTTRTQMFSDHSTGVIGVRKMRESQHDLLGRAQSLVIRQ